MATKKIPKPNLHFRETVTVPLVDLTSKFSADFRALQALSRIVGDSVFVTIDRHVDDSTGMVSITYEGTRTVFKKS